MIIPTCQCLLKFSTSINYTKIKESVSEANYRRTILNGVAYIRLEYYYTLANIIGLV